MLLQINLPMSHSLFVVLLFVLLDVRVLDVGVLLRLAFVSIVAFQSKLSVFSNTIIYIFVLRDI